MYEYRKATGLLVVVEQSGGNFYYLVNKITVLLCLLFLTVISMHAKIFKSVF